VNEHPGLVIYPERIQRRRTRGWKMPPNTVSVTRPGRWGNPYAVDVYGIELSLKLFRDTVRGIWSPENVAALDDELAGATYKLHCRFRERIGCHPTEAARSELRGRNLACWCSIHDPCHADILREIANS
jgi:hypothetical protein